MLFIDFHDSLSVGTDLSALLPHSIAEMSVDDVARIPIPSTANPDQRVGDVASVKTQPDPTAAPAINASQDTNGAILQLAGDLKNAVHVARGMDGGQLSIIGDLGDDVAEDFRGGRLTIQGNVGDRLGGCGAGRRVGISGGCIHVDGNIGAAAACRMRRGMLAVRGDCGPGLAGCMIAGTICVGGSISRGACVGMRRGTILANHAAPQTPARMTQPDQVRIQFLRLLPRSLPGWMVDALLSLFDGSFVSRRRMDRSVDGLGEWITPSAAI
ncbi:MAG: hypothetical protein AAFP90_08675 [Planctomycetota bacterium]